MLCWGENNSGTSCASTAPLVLTPILGTPHIIQLDFLWDFRVHDEGTRHNTILRITWISTAMSTGYKPSAIWSGGGRSLEVLVHRQILGSKCFKLGDPQSRRGGPASCHPAIDPKGTTAGINPQLALAISHHSSWHQNCEKLSGNFRRNK